MANHNTQRSRPRCEVICSEVVHDTRTLCSHIFADDHRCASPALRGQTLCYHHQPTRISLPTRNQHRAQRHARRTFPIPRPTNPHEIRQTIMVILHAVAADTIAPRRAGRLLAALQHMNGDFSRNLQWDGPAAFPPTSKSANMNTQHLLSQSRGPQ